MLDGCTPWPADQAAAYRDAGYWRGTTLGAQLHALALAHGPRTALVSGERRITYRDLDDQVNRYAHGLRADGIRPGERVVVQLPNIPEFVAVVFALLRLGAHPVFSVPAHRQQEIIHLCRASEAAAYVVADTHAGVDYRTLASDVAAQCDQLRRVYVVGRPGPFAPLPEQDPGAPLPDADPADVAFFLLSGGTTALPKLIPRTHDDYLHMAHLSAQVCGFSTETVYLAALPAAYTFTFGNPGVLGTLLCGGTVVLAPTPSPETCFALIEREHVTATSLVPTVAGLWLEEAEWAQEDLSSLRLIQVGGGKLDPTRAVQLTETFQCTPQQVFGMAEGLIVCTRLDDSPETITHTQGRPLSPADDIKIVDDHDLPVSPGHTGQLLARGPYTLRGYFRTPEHNTAAFTPDGYYRTGDLVRQTTDGNIVVEGRLKEMINKGGDKVSAPEVEQHLCAHPAISAAAVIAMPDPDLGERVCAFIVASTPAPTLAEVRYLLATAGLAPYKHPDRLETLDELPVTGLGKIDKKALTAVLARSLTPPTKG
ncbi:(2,3-dihydroxybenzoyl)adenylate synthase [Kitasatospora sp. NPDC094011]|uniref:(2,3-dihydroxybenzoyl)adenylate synthase n=1 Tax=Kitasatospora sp. NPDC094011 TaxID=3364090 RepID=UPI0038084A38